MVNYSNNTIDVSRYFIAYILTHVSYCVIKPTVIRLLKYAVGGDNFDDSQTILSFVEYGGFIIGSVWGSFSLIRY